jgi:hypothetical protein
MGNISGSSCRSQLVEQYRSDSALLHGQMGPVEAECCHMPACSQPNQARAATAPCRTVSPQLVQQLSLPSSALRDALEGLYRAARQPGSAASLGRRRRCN